MEFNKEMLEGLDFYFDTAYDGFGKCLDFLGEKHDGTKLQQLQHERIDEKVKNAAIFSGFPQNVEIHRLNYDVRLIPNITKEQAIELSIKYYNLKTQEDVYTFSAKHGLTVPLSFFNDNMHFVDINIIIRSKPYEYEQLDNNAIDKVKSNFKLDLSRFDDEKVMDKIEKMIDEKSSMYQAHEDARATNIAEYLNQFDKYDDIDGFDFEIFMSDIPRERELVKPKDTSSICRLVLKLIDEQKFTTLEQANHFFYDEYKLIDVCIENGLTTLYESDSTDEKFLIVYPLNKEKVIEVVDEYMKMEDEI
mgnify:FL=1